MDSSCSSEDHVSIDMSNIDFEEPLENEVFVCKNFPPKEQCKYCNRSSVDDCECCCIEYVEDENESKFNV